MTGGKNSVRDTLAKQIDLSLVQEMDVICLSGRGVLSVIIQEETLQPLIVTGSPFSHVALALRPTGEELMWFEFAEKGGRFEDLTKYESCEKGLALMRPKSQFTNMGVKLCRMKAVKLAGTGYDATGLLGKLLHIIFGRKMWKKNPLSGAGYFCSAGVEAIYRIGGLYITPYRDVRLNEPKDFFISNELRRIV